MVRRLLPGMLQAVMAAVWLTSASLPASAASDRRAVVVNDPHYGEVLYYFYQQKYFSALGTLMTSQHFNRFAQHADEAELLRGGLLLSYGVHLEAGRIFERLIADGASPVVRDRAWFFLAKIRYQRGYVEEAEDALGRIGDKLPFELENERHLLKAFLFMKRERYADAIVELRRIDRQSELARYGRFNLGVAMVRATQTESGSALLDELGREPAKTEEFRALRDKANVALGFAYLQSGKPDRARHAFERVRLEGLMANIALLGMGWAHSAENHQERALVLWQELKGRNLQDAAVQESLLASSYALGKLGAWRRSLEQYESAIEIYTNELAQIDRSIKAIRGGKLASMLIRETPSEELGWFWELRRLPDSPETRYLSSLLAGHGFQEALKNHRDLQFLTVRLGEWVRDLDSYQDMLATRRRRYMEQLPSVLTRQTDAQIAQRRSARGALAAQIDRVGRDDDADALATTKQREQLDRLERIRGVLSFETVDDETWERYRLLRGLMRWDMETDFPDRYWQTRKSLQELDRALDESEQSRVRLDRARQQAPAIFERYEKRIRDLEPRIRALQVRSRALAQDQGSYIAETAVTALQAQRLRIATYLTQARFAVAQIYDQSSGQADRDAP